MVDELFYISAYSDEIMPCAATLEGWAEWLNKPDRAWGRPKAAVDGEIFEAFTMRVLANVTATFTGGVWIFDDPPAETETVFVRHGDEDSGWDVEASAYFAPNFGESPNRAGILDAVDGAWSHVDEGETCLLACVASGDNVEIRFNRTPEGPRCYVTGQVGRA